jgi:hypothetical protein
MARKIINRIERRLWKFIFTEPNSGCWLWGGTLSSYGYGIFLIKSSTSKSGFMARAAHRICYEFYKGKVPEGLDLDHKCRVRCCVNPEHLEPVTRQVNLLRGVGIPAVFAKRTHCNNGHPFGGQNLIIDGGFRRCRTCKNARKIAAYQANRDAINARRRKRRSLKITNELPLAGE